MTLHTFCCSTFPGFLVKALVFSEGLGTSALLDATFELSWDSPPVVRSSVDLVSLNSTEFIPTLELVLLEGALRVSSHVTNSIGSLSHALLARSIFLFISSMPEKTGDGSLSGLSDGEDSDMFTARLFVSNKLSVSSLAGSGGLASKSLLGSFFDTASDCSLSSFSCWCKQLCSYCICTKELGRGQTDRNVYNRGGWMEGMYTQKRKTPLLTKPLGILYFFSVVH